MDDFTEQDDRWMRDALQGVSVPAGLRERIRGSLRQEAAAQLGPAPASGNSSRHGGSPGPTAVSPTAASPTAPQPSTTTVAAGPQGLSDASQAQVQLPPPSGAPRERRRSWIALTLAVSAAALLFGAYQWSRPYSLEHLAGHSLRQLEFVLREDAAWNADISEHFSELAVLDGQLRGHVEPLGFQNQPGEPIADRCRVWKLYSNTTRKAFYVFDYQDAHDVQQLTSQLQPLNRVSGGWSMFALRTADRVVVVLMEGAPDNYLYRLQAA